LLQVVKGKRGQTRHFLWDFVSRSGPPLTREDNGLQLTVERFGNALVFLLSFKTLKKAQI
jgi:hypothetical protein